MECPKCKRSDGLLVKDSRHNARDRIRRRRKCIWCHHKFTTIEVPVVMVPGKHAESYVKELEDLLKGNNATLTEQLIELIETERIKSGRGTKGSDENSRETDSAVS